MDFTQWLQAKGIDPASLSLEARTALQASWRAEQNQQPAPPAQQVPVPQATTQPPPPQPPAPSAGAATTPSSFDQKMAVIEAENARQEYIREATQKACERNLGNSEKCKQLREMCDAAINDKTTTIEKFQLKLVHTDYYNGPTILAPRGEGKDVTAEVLEAAICQTNRLPNLEKRFSADTLQQAHSRFRRGLGLKQLIFLAAQRNDGYRGDFMDEEAMCRAAFRPHGFDGPMSNVSTINVAGILSNVANKFLAEPFMFTEQSWRQISRIRSANDFKQMTTYRLTSATKFEKVAPGGEIKHGTLDELTYTNQVETYGKMIGISRTDIINDDLGAFTSVASELARGAGDSLNEVFWTEFLDDAAFFPTDKSLGNYDDGAVDSLLSLAGLENADAIFAAQTKPDGTPLGVRPAILLVPRGLRSRAMTLMSATGLVGQGEVSAAVPNENPWAGMFQVVDSVYLTQTAIGGSTTAWYLLSDPNNLAVIEVAFLFGRDTPIVETSEFDFHRLGQSWRAYFDFGIAKQEYRAGVKMKGIT